MIVDTNFAMVWLICGIGAWKASFSNTKVKSIMSLSLCNPITELTHFELDSGKTQNCAFCFLL